MTDGEGAPEIVVCLCAAPDADAAERIARALVDERLIACASLLPGALSVYRWEGEVRREPEVLLLLKTRRSRVAEMKARLAALHPYQVPELLVCPVVEGLEAYRRWVVAET